MFAVRKLLETPNYGCKAVNLGELAALAQAWEQPHPVCCQAVNFVPPRATRLACWGVSLVGGLSAQPVLVLLHPHPATSPRQANTSSSLLGWLVSLFLCAGTGKGTSVLEMVNTFEAATGGRVCVCVQL